MSGEIAASFGKVRIIIQRCHVKKKKNVNEPKVSSRKSKSMTKTSLLSNFYSRTTMLQAQVVLISKLPHVFEEYVPIILPSCAEYFRLSLPCRGRNVL